MKALKQNNEIKPEWRTLKQCADFLGKSKQAIHQWELEPAGIIGQTNYYHIEDILRVAFDKNGFIPPTFTMPDGEIVDYKQELALKTQQERIRLELANKEKIGELLPVDMFIDAVSRIGSHWGASLDGLVLNIKRKVPEVKSSTLQVIDKLRINMQNELADWDMGIQSDIEQKKTKEN